MELGEKLRLTRLEAGLSQRALCGDEITRNMLSRIENGAARPSMKTLGCLAARLGKPVSYFLEEDTVCSPNQEIMTAVRQLFDGKDYAGAMRALAQYRAPDEIYDWERQLLEILVRLCRRGHLGRAGAIRFGAAGNRRRFGEIRSLLFRRSGAAQTSAACPHSGAGR